MHDSFITRSAVCTPTIITLTSFLEPISSLNLTSPYAGVRPLNFLSKAVKRRLPSHLCPHFKSGASERAEFRWDLNLYNYVRNGYYEENMLVSEMEPLTVSAPSGRLPPLAAPPHPPPLPQVPWLTLFPPWNGVFGSITQTCSFHCGFHHLFI